MGIPKPSYSHSVNCQNSPFLKASRLDEVGAGRHAARIGYARVSTDEQSLGLQRDALRAAGCDVIYEDRGVSGATCSRSGLDKALRHLRSGDTLVTWKLDRLGRSLAHLIALTEELDREGVGFVSLSEAIDTRSPGGRLLFHVMGALAEFERSLIGERTRAGIAAARVRGSRVGRPPKLTDADARRAARRLASGKENLNHLAKGLAVSPLTLRRALCRLDPTLDGAK